MEKRKKDPLPSGLLYAGIIALALFLRLYRLGEESLWFDELKSLMFTRMDVLAVLRRPYSIPPLYHLFLKGWCTLFGTGSFALRLPSVFFGVLSVVLLIKLGRLLFNERVGLSAGFLMAIAPLHIYYAQEARNYTLVVFLTLVAVLAFLRVVSDGRARNFLFFGCVLFLLLATHFYALFTLIALSIAFFMQVKDKRARRRWLITHLIVALLYLPLVVILVNNLEMIYSRGLFWLQRPSIKGSLFAVAEAFSYGGRSFGGADFSLSFPAVRIPQFLTYVFIFLSLIALRGMTPRLLFVYLWLLVSVATPIVFSKALFPAFIVRHTIMASPAWYLLAAKGAAELKKPALRVLTALLIIALTLPMLKLYYVQDIKQPWGKTAGYLTKTIAPDTVVVYYPSFWQLSIEHYFPGYRLLEFAKLKERWERGQKVEAVGPQDNHLLLIDFLPRSGYPKIVDSLIAHLAGDWALKEEGDCGGIYWGYYERVP